MTTAFDDWILVSGSETFGEWLDRRASEAEIAKDHPLGVGVGGGGAGGFGAVYVSYAYDAGLLCADAPVGSPIPIRGPLPTYVLLH